ncbi:MAG TPA: hypothetical protein VIM77_08355 [Mucilaginibacter sp.]
MKLIIRINEVLFSKNIDHRIAKSFKRIREADQVTASINRQLIELDEKLKLNAVK